MIAFERLSEVEEGMLTAVGFGLLVIMVFLLLSLWQFVRFIRHSEQIKFFPLFLIISGVISLLFIFSDVALLSDIHRQYRYGLSQPEWTLVLPILIGQFGITILFQFIHFTDRYSIRQSEHPAKDINIFLIVQYTGIISGLMGWGMAGLGFIYSTGWNLTTHGIIGSTVILFPYILVLFYWFITKLQEKDRLWFDEKQKIDLGKSALLTLIVDTVLLLTLFILNISNLSGMIHLLWLPMYLFTTILLFSSGNIYYSNKG
jgi:hypothetical protein